MMAVLSAGFVLYADFSRGEPGEGLIVVKMDAA